MSSSSRSIAAARQKRAGEQVQKMNTSRPVTSISSQSAFAQQFQQQQQQMMNAPSSIGNRNIRSVQTNQPLPSPVMPQVSQDQITKISVSDAVGLITLRLGRLESIVNESIEDGMFKHNSDNNIEKNIIPSNMKLVSDEVFENIVNRINLLESKMISFNNQLENITKEVSDVKNIVVDNNSTIHSFMNETNEKFVIYENALAEIESNLEVVSPVEANNDEVVVTSNENESTTEVAYENMNETVFNFDNIIATENN
jgi:hypothetical protein